MKSLGIVELGSTNTKGYIYNNGNLQIYRFANINFKDNYKKRGYIIDEDKILLLNYLQEIRKNADSVYLYGTSVFRQMDTRQLNDFKTWLVENGYSSFEVVTAEEENELTVYGVTKHCKIDSTIAVMIGGGGSTEISICQNGKIIEQVNTPIGVGDIQEHFPKLTDNITEDDLDEVMNYVSNVIRMPGTHADILVLAGGDFILRYEKALYPVTTNTIFDDKNCPYMISTKKNIEHDRYYYNHMQLNELRKHTPDTPKWWDGTRAMCACVDAVAQNLDAKILIPTSMSMIYGIIEKIITKS